MAAQQHTGRRGGVSPPRVTTIRPLLLGEKAGSEENAEEGGLGRGLVTSPSDTNSQNDLVEWGCLLGPMESALRGVIGTGRFPSISLLFVNYGAEARASSILCKQTIAVRQKRRSSPRFGLPAKDSKAKQ